MKSNYWAYLLRIWKIGEVDSPVLAASLEDPHTHQVIHFSSIEHLAQYLQDSILYQDGKRYRGSVNLSETLTDEEGEK